MLTCENAFTKKRIVEAGLAFAELDANPHLELAQVKAQLSVGQRAKTERAEGRKVMFVRPAVAVAVTASGKLPS
jgi:hypothetical protein